MSFLKRFDTALDKLFEPKVNPIKVLETKIFDKLVSDNTLLEQRLTDHAQTIMGLSSKLENLETVLANHLNAQAAQIESLSSKLEKIEVYSGMTRRVDATTVRPKAFTEM